MDSEPCVNTCAIDVMMNWESKKMFPDESRFDQVNLANAFMESLDDSTWFVCVPEVYREVVEQQVALYVKTKEQYELKPVA